MSLSDYRRSLELSYDNTPFGALIMAAIRKADSVNLTLLQVAFPEIWHELDERYNAPGGVIASDHRNG